MFCWLRRWSPSCCGHAVDAVVILAVVIINATIGFIQEGRAEKALDAIRAMLTHEASVLRDGRRLTVPVESLVVGDVVLAEAGDRIPADLRLLRATNLRIEEAVLTGESAPADKSTDPVAPDAPLGDRASIAFSGTLVASGQGAGLVVATGAATELGRISAMVGGVESLTTPLLRQMDAFAKRLTHRHSRRRGLRLRLRCAVRGYEIEHAFMAAVGVAVAAIPEGLPAVMTITLAIGVRRMAQRNAIIRRLPAVETLGAVSTICSDKTGTLTLNQMTAVPSSQRRSRSKRPGPATSRAARSPLDGVAIEPSAYPALARDRARRADLQRCVVAPSGAGLDRRRRSDGGRADRLGDKGGHGRRGRADATSAAGGDSLRLPPSVHGGPQRAGAAGSSPSRARPNGCWSYAAASARRPATNRLTRQAWRAAIDRLAAAASASSPSPPGSRRRRGEPRLRPTLKAAA